MNQTEIKAFKWFLEQGIDKDDIIFRSNKSPDFIIKDGRKFEVKKSTGNKIRTIRIREDQFNDLIADQKTKILIFGDEDNSPPTILPVNSIKKGFKCIDKTNVNVSWIKGKGENICYGINIPKKLWKDFRICLRKVYWKKGITINNGFVKLIEKFIKENE